MLKKKKIVIIISIFTILFTFCINSKVFATEVDVSYYDTLLKNEKRPYLLFRDKGKAYFSLFILPCNNHYKDWDYDHDDIFLYISGNDVIARNSTKNEETRHFADYATDNGKDIRCVHSCWGGTINWLTEGYLQESEAYSNTKVYADISKKEVFFLKPLPQRYQIPQITKTEELTTVIKKVVEMIVPIGLIVFGILFVILLVRLVISHKV